MHTREPFGVHPLGCPGEWEAQGGRNAGTSEGWKKTGLINLNLLLLALTGGEIFTTTKHDKARQSTTSLEQTWTEGTEGLPAINHQLPNHQAPSYRRGCHMGCWRRDTVTSIGNIAWN